MTTPFTTCKDNALIELALAGQSECFTVLMDRHLAAVRRRITSMVRNATDVDEILQQVVLKVWRHLSAFRSESSFRSWVIRVAINEALQSFRQQRRAQCCHTIDDLDTLASPHESPHQVLVRFELTQAVHKAVGRLPEKYRQVLILRDLEELSGPETAQRLQLSIPAVKARLFRARLMLLVALQSSKVPDLANAA